MQFVKSNRGKQKLLYEGYIYIKQKDSEDDTDVYECELRRSKASCKAKVKVLEGEIIEKINDHTHNPNTPQCEVAKIFKQIVKHQVKTEEIAEQLVNCATMSRQVSPQKSARQYEEEEEAEQEEYVRPSKQMKKESETLQEAVQNIVIPEEERIFVIDAATGETISSVGKSGEVMCPETEEVVLTMEESYDPLYEESSNFKRAGHSKTFWNKTSVLILLKAMKKYFPRFNEEKRAVVWDEIYAEISPKLPGVSLRSVEVKWKNLKKVYHTFCKHLENQDANGERDIRKPFAFDFMRTFVKNPYRNPPRRGVFVDTPPVAEVNGARQHYQQLSYEDDEEEEALGNPAYSSRNSWNDFTSAAAPPTPKLNKSMSQADRMECLHNQVLGELKTSGRRLESLMCELSQQQKIMISNQNELLQIERRRNELLERKLCEDSKQKNND